MRPRSNNSQLWFGRKGVGGALDVVSEKKFSPNSWPPHCRIAAARTMTAFLSFIGYLRSQGCARSALGQNPNFKPTCSQDSRVVEEKSMKIEKKEPKKTKSPRPALRPSRS
jgi:hypothetical protein